MTKKQKLQKWFNKNYSQDGRKETKEINISDKQSKLSDGPLEIRDFKFLEKIELKNFKLVSFGKLGNLKIVNCSQLIKIDLSKFTSNLIISNCSELTEVEFSDCHIENLFVGDCPELTKLNCCRSQLTNLDLSNHNLLNKLDCSGNKLTELSVSNLTDLDCSNNSIDYLNLNLCPEIIKLDCSNNQLIHLEISNCSKLDVLNFSNNKLTRLNISNCPKLKSRPELEELAKKINLKLIKDRSQIVRNILVVGRTGGGKSTLANVLSNTSEFKESEGSISKTKNFQNETFEYNEITYRVIDTIGVGDTNMAKKKVLYKIAEGIYSMPEGLSHVLFVVDGRFTTEEIETFLTFQKAIFETKIVEYITIVRNKFSSFKNYWECEIDKQDLRNESKQISGIVEACNDILYVDNPPINFKAYDDDDTNMININEKIRSASRNRLLDYLETKCQKECQEKCHPKKCQKELEEHRKNCKEKHKEVWQDESQKIWNNFLKRPKDEQEILLKKSLKKSQDKLQEELKRKCQDEHQEKCKIKEHQKKCKMTVQQKEHQEQKKIFCQEECYYKLKEWDMLRDEIAFYMKDIKLEGENLEKIEELMDKIAEITEQRLKNEIPAFIRVLNKVKEDCSIV